MNAEATFSRNRKVSQPHPARLPVSFVRRNASTVCMNRAICSCLHKRAWLRRALLVALLFATVPAQAATNVWSGGGSDNTWTNTGNWYGAYSPGNTNQFTNVTTTINFSISTSTAGILLSDTASNVTLTNTANTMTLTGGYGLNVQTGTLNVNAGTVTLGTAQTWTVASGAAINIGANVNKAAFLLTISNDAPATISGIISGTGGLTKSGADALTLGGINTYSGNTTVRGGTLSVSGSINGGGTVTITNGAILDVERANVTSGKNWNISGTVSSGSGFYQTLGNLTLNSGTLTGVGSDNAQFGFYTINAGNSVTATGNSQIIAPGHFTFQGAGSVTFNVVNAIDILTISSPITNAASTAGLDKTGSGLLTLAGTNTYLGPTTITAGTLTLGLSGSLPAVSSLSIAAGATFDVSGLGASATYTLGSGVTLTASGTGTAVGTSAATIKGGVTGRISLGARPITLTYDGAHPALYLSQGTLALNGNAFTVNTATPLAAGTYAIVQQASGNISSNGTLTISGTAIGPGTLASIQVSGGNVNLLIVIRPPYLTISSVNGGANPIAGIGFNAVVRVLFGNAVPTNVVANTTVTLTRTTGTGTLGGNLSGPILAGTGSVTITGVTYTKAESGVVLTATPTTGDIMPAGNSAAFTVNPGAATTLTQTSGNNQTGNRWATLASPFVVTVADAYANPVSGTSVIFAIGTVPSGATLQSLSLTNTTTAVNGQTSTILTLGNMAGTYRVTAASGTLSGSPVTFTATANPGNYAVVPTVTYEYQICFKCHSGYAWLPGSPPNGLSPNGSVLKPVETDQAQEFSPNNRSGHPIVSGLNNYTNSLAPRALLASAMKPPWNVNLGTQTMLCSDCHDATTTNYVAGAAQGPHGSANQFILRGPNAANWPNVPNSSIGSSWCMNCHNNNAGEPHGGDHSGTQCYVCHIVIPHGGTVSRLIATSGGNLPARYAWNNNPATVGITLFTKTTAGGYSENGNCRTSCGHHASGSGNESW